MADEIEALKKEIVEKTKDELTKELDNILETKYVGVEEFEKVKSLLQKETELNKANTGDTAGFTKFLQDASKKALTEGTGSAGGYTVPPKYSTQIFQLQQKFARVLPLTTQITIGNTNSFKGVSLANDVSVAWVDEGAPLGETAPTFSQPVITIKKLGALVKLSNELLNDSGVNLDAFINALIARATAKELDNQIINGSGSPFTGILNASGTVSVVSGTALANVAEYDDLINVETALSDDYALDPKWILHRNVFKVIRKWKDSTGRPLDVVDAKAKEIDGIPYIRTERAPSDTATASAPILIYGDPANVFVARRQNLTMQVLKEKYADTDQTGLKFIARYGIQVMAPQAFVILHMAAS